jgi:hypothetical protein
VLFATLSTEAQALLITICTLFGGGVTWVVTRLWDWKKENRQNLLEDSARKRKEDIEDDNRTIQHLETLIDRGEKLRVEMREDYRKLEAEFRQTERLAERAVAWIVHLEQLLQSNKIPHPKWKDYLEAGSQEHRPIQPGPSTPPGE